MTKDKDINIAANDETIISGANNLSYMYSVNDVHNIAIALRQQYLNYEGMQDANPGEEYAYLRENNNQILLLDAYALQNLQNGIEDDVDKIISEGSGTRWHNPPQTILIPFLTAAHWISIKVDINYNDRSASLLWDNPYGLSYEAVEYQVAGKTISSTDIIANVRSAVQLLIQHYLQDNEFTLTEDDGGNWTLNHQQMDQQGLGIDGVSCGTITLRNIEDYLDARVNHGQSLPAEYTIPAYKSNYMQNRTKLHAAKKEHVKMYCKVAEEEIPTEETETFIVSPINEPLFNNKNPDTLDKEITEFENQLFAQFNFNTDHTLANQEEEKTKVLAAIKDAYSKTQEYVDDSQFKQAEEEIVKILRPVLSKPEAKSLYVSVKDIPTEALSVLHHLGQIYLRDSSYYNNHVKASAIFQYCARFSKEYKVIIELPDGTAGDEQYFTKQAYLVERDFLSSRGRKVEEAAAYVESSTNKLELSQSELLAIREITKEELEDIENLGIEQIAERTEKVQDIYKICTDFFVTPDKEQQGLVQRLILESIEQLGAIPEGCQYSITGLGSLAFGTMTPWSDLEFAVLIKDKENKGREDEYREYFRNLTKLLWIKVINFGETPLSAVGVDSLNNYKTGEEQDNWFEDNITGKAFRFDPVYEDACKSALGRQGDYVVTKKFKNKDGIEETKTIKKPNYELIKTPKEMMEFQDRVLRELPEDDKGKEKEDAQNKVDNTQDSWFYTEKHLVQTLQTPVLISGSKELLGEYRQELKQFRDDNPELLQTRALQLLQEDINKFSLKLGHEEEGKLFNVKTTIYRLGDRIVNALANYYGITTEEDEHSITVWQIIDRMEQRELLSSKGAQHLKEAISISTGLRLSTYSHNEGRFDNLSTYEPIIADHLNEKQKKELMEKTFHVHDTSILHHFYYVMTDLQKIIQIFCNNEHHNFGQFLLINKDLLSDDNYNKAMVQARFQNLKLSIEYMEEIYEENQGNLHFLESLLHLYDKTKLFNKATKTAKLLLELVLSEYNDNPNKSSVVIKAYNNLGLAYRNEENNNQALDCYHMLLEKYNLESDLTISSQEAAMTYSGLAAVFCNKGEYNQAIKYYTKALTIYLKDFYFNQNYKDIVDIYNNLGVVFNKKDEYNKAIDCGKKSLAIYSYIHTNSPNHSDIINCYNNLGTTYHNYAKFDKAKEYYLIALEMATLHQNHISTANAYVNLGILCNTHDEFDSSIKYHYRALEIYLEVYESNSNHPTIANCYNNLGEAYRHHGNYEQAIKYYEKALTTNLQCGASNYNNIIIAKRYNNLGITYVHKGNGNKAIEYYQKALKIIIQTESHNSSFTASVYNNLGAQYNDNHQYDNAIKAYNKALEIKQNIYKTNLIHPSIAAAYNNLALVYGNIGEYNKALNYHKLAIQIQLKVYIPAPLHSSIARSCSNLGSILKKKGEYSKAIKYYTRAVEIDSYLYKESSQSPELATDYGNLGILLITVGKYDQAMSYCQESYQMSLNIFTSDTNHPLIAIRCRNLGAAYNALKKYDEAIKYYKQSIEMVNQIYCSDPNHPEITASYNNLAIALINKEQYQDALEYALKTNNQQFCNLVRMLCGNQALLNDDEECAKRWYIQIDPTYITLEFFSKQFIELNIKNVNLLYNIELLPAAITCQHVLLLVDPIPELKNYYHNLACFYASNNEILLAKHAFDMALLQSPHLIKSCLYAEYAHFLIQHSSMLETDPKIISEYLHLALNQSEDNTSLGYGKIEKDVIDEVLSDLITTTNQNISISSKVLVLYLMLKNSEYIKEEDDVDELIMLFQKECDKHLNFVYHILFVNICKKYDRLDFISSYNDESIAIKQFNDLVTGKFKIEQLQIDNLLGIEEETININALEEIAKKFKLAALYANNHDNNMEAGRIHMKLFQYYYQKINIINKLEADEDISTLLSMNQEDNLDTNNLTFTNIFDD